MSNVNEEIVRLYYEIKGYMVHQNLKYTIHKEKSSGESDIDLAIYNPKTHVKAIVEVKGWHTETFSKVYFSLLLGLGIYRQYCDFLSLKRARPQDNSSMQRNIVKY